MSKKKTGKKTGGKIAFVMRHPRDFREAAENTLGAGFRELCRRIENPEAGDAMPDGTVYAGVEPETGKRIFAAPADASFQMMFNEAAQYARTACAEKYLGHDDWRVPSRAELNVLFENRQKGALAGTFQEAGVFHADYDAGRSAFYWSSESYRGKAGYGQWFDDGTPNYIDDDIGKSVRLVRSPKG